MAAYLIVDVDNLIAFTLHKGADLQELAVALRGNAALVAGLFDSTMLRSIAVGNWESHQGNWNVEPEQIFQSVGYEILDVKQRSELVSCLMERHIAADPNPIDELILATTSDDLLPLIDLVKTTRSARIRMWGSEDVIKGSRYAEDIIFQSLGTLPGIQTKNVWVYIDFENISISLNEQGFMVNLDHLIERFVSQAQAHGKLVKMAAYAPWGQRGALPPLVDTSGREVADEAPSRLMMANIDPVFNLPGKNSADIRIARDVLTDAGHPEAGDVIILASSDRDFNDVINPLLQRNKTVVLWGVRGSTGRLLQSHPSLHLEFIDDFTDLQTHESLSKIDAADEAETFIPSQWSSVILQFFRLNAARQSEEITLKDLIRQLVDVGDVISLERGNDLVSQAISLGLLRQLSDSGALELDYKNPVVDKTLVIAERMVKRVSNTLLARNWEYVNYGFLLKGLAMERDLDRPGMNDSDQWRSHWIDCLVRERVLQRDLVPHRHNPEDLVPVIRIPTNNEHPVVRTDDDDISSEEQITRKWLGVPPHMLYNTEPEVAHMVMRIAVSVQQFTSFRNFAWCPLGSLHRRLREFDSGVVFQHAVEYLLINEMVSVNEYPNPRSDYNTKGIELNPHSAFVAILLAERDEFVRILLEMYKDNTTISEANIKPRLDESWDVALWISIMKIENVLNPLPGRTDQFSLFRTHHTVKLVANDDVSELQRAED